MRLSIQLAVIVVIVILIILFYFLMGSKQKDHTPHGSYANRVKGLLPPSYASIYSALVSAQEFMNDMIKHSTSKADALNTIKTEATNLSQLTAKDYLNNVEAGEIFSKGVIWPPVVVAYTPTAAQIYEAVSTNPNALAIAKKAKYTTSETNTQFQKLSKKLAAMQPSDYLKAAAAHSKSKIALSTVAWPQPTIASA